MSAPASQLTGPRQYKDRRRDSLAVITHALPWVLIAAAPVAFAIATWNDFPQPVRFAAIRLFGVPVLVLELCTIIVSLRLDWRPLEQLRSLSIATRGLLVGLLAIAFWTAIFAAPRPRAAIVWTDISLLHLVFGFAVAHLAREATELKRRLIWPAIVAGLSIFAIMLMVFVNMSHPASFDWVYLGFGVTNVRQLGSYSAIGTAAALGVAVQRRGLPQALFALGAGLIFSTALWSGTRGAVIAVASALLLLLVLFPAVRSLRTFFVTLGTSTVAVFIAMHQSPPDRHYGFWRFFVTGPTADKLSSGRITVWRDTWDSFLTRPLFGFGEAQLAFVRPEINGDFLHPHNFVLQLLLQWGIAGTAIFGALGVIAIRGCRGSVSDDAELVMPAAFVALTIATYSLFDGALFHTYPVMMFAVAVAILISSNARRRETN